jgi:hypothetical protein
MIFTEHSAPALAAAEMAHGTYRKFITLNKDLLQQGQPVPASKRILLIAAMATLPDGIPELDISGYVSVRGYAYFQVTSLSNFCTRQPAFRHSVYSTKEGGAGSVTTTFRLFDSALNQLVLTGFQADCGEEPRLVEAHVVRPNGTFFGVGVAFNDRLYPFPPSDSVLAATILCAHVEQVLPGHQADLSPEQLINPAGFTDTPARIPFAVA